MQEDSDLHALCALSGVCPRVRLGDDTCYLEFNVIQHMNGILYLRVQYRRGHGFHDDVRFNLREELYDSILYDCIGKLAVPNAILWEQLDKFASVAALKNGLQDHFYKTASGELLAFASYFVINDDLVDKLDELKERLRKREAPAIRLRKSPNEEQF